MTLEERLEELDAHVSRMVYTPWMQESDEAQDFLADELWPEYPKLLQFDEQEMGWYNDTAEDQDPIEFLHDLGYSGWYFSVQGHIFKKSPTADIYWGTNTHAVEYGYAPSTEKLEETINEALDRLQPRLREDS
jgi:hypothetical protein